jgi:ribosomal protein S24E
VAATISKTEIIRKLSETLGVDKAGALVEEAASAVGLAGKTDYNQEEILKLLEHLKQQGGIIKIIAGFLAAEAHLMNM